MTWITDQWSDRTLSMVASYVAGTNVQVMRTARLERPMTVALRRPTLLLRPGDCGLYDLLLGAEAVRSRPVLRKKCKGGRFDDATKHGVWMRARRALRERHGRCEALRGFAREDSVDPELVWDRVTFSELDMASWNGGVYETAISGVSPEGCDRDVEHVIAAAREGKLELEDVPGLREAQVLRVPRRILVPPGLPPQWERLADTRAKADDVARSLTRCYLRKSEDFEERRRVPSPRLAGSRLVLSRLHRVSVEGRLGKMPRVFLPNGRRHSSTFRPHEHFAILGFDAHGFEHCSSHWTRLSETVMMAWLRAYEILGIDVVVVAFRDRLVPLGKGQRLYLHVPVVIKAYDEPFDDTTWHRMVQVIQERPRGKGEPTCFQPLQMGTLRQFAAKALRTRSYQYVSCQFLAHRGLVAGKPAPDYWSRTAQALESAWRGFESDHEHWWEEATSWMLPPALVDASPEGSPLRRRATRLP